VAFFNYLTHPIAHVCIYKSERLPLSSSVGLGLLRSKQYVGKEMEQFIQT
jgi:hypothetical protein